MGAGKQKGTDNTKPDDGGEEAEVETNKGGFFDLEEGFFEIHG